MNAVKQLGQLLLCHQSDTDSAACEHAPCPWTSRIPNGSAKERKDGRLPRAGAPIRFRRRRGSR